MNNKNKYPRSINGRQCLGPCTKQGNIILHPISLEYIVNTDHPFCPVIDHKYPHITLDECKLSEVNNKDINHDHFSTVTPLVGFTCSDFLKDNYNIYSIENMLQYINSNSDIPKTSKIRLINCSWKEFGSNKNNISDIFVDFYRNFIKKYWIKSFYSHLGKSLFYDNEKNIVVHTKNTAYITDDEMKKHLDEKIYFLMKNVYDFKSVHDIMFDFIDKNIKNWTWIESHHKKIKKMFILYGINKLK